MKEIYFDNNEQMSIDKFVREKLEVKFLSRRHYQLLKFKEDYFHEYCILITKVIILPEFKKARENFESFCIKKDKEAYSNDTELF